MRVLARQPHEDLGWILRFFIARLLRALKKRPSFDLEMTPMPGWRYEPSTWSVARQQCSNKACNKRPHFAKVC